MDATNDARRRGDSRKGRAMLTFLSIIGIAGVLVAFGVFSVRATSNWSQLLSEFENSERIDLAAFLSLAPGL
jgi:hypothetical protein